MFWAASRTEDVEESSVAIDYGHRLGRWARYSIRTPGQIMSAKGLLLGRERT